MNEHGVRRCTLLDGYRARNGRLVSTIEVLLCRVCDAFLVADALIEARVDFHARGHPDRDHPERLIETRRLEG
jgi:hypothetical protein